MHAAHLHPLWGQFAQATGAGPSRTVQSSRAAAVEHNDACPQEPQDGAGTTARAQHVGTLHALDRHQALPKEEVVSHEGNSIPSTPVDSSASILLMGQESDIVGIDEAQFFDEHIVETCNELASRGIRVIVAGLDLDFNGQPFGPMPALCVIADEVTKVHAICVRCGALAYVSHRIVAGDKQVMLGEKQEYEPLCRECYNKAILKAKE